MQGIDSFDAVSGQVITARRRNPVMRWERFHSLYLILAALITLALAWGCGDDGEEKETPTTTATAAGGTGTPTAGGSPQVTKEATLKIGGMEPMSGPRALI